MNRHYDALIQTHVQREVASSAPNGYCASCGKRPGKYFMCWEKGDNGKHSGMVCSSCDNRLGRHNLEKYAGMSRHQAVVFERYLAATEDVDDPVSWDEYLAAGATE